MVNRSVSLSVTFVRHAIMAQPIEMPVGLLTVVGQRNYLLDGCRRKRVMLGIVHPAPLKTTGSLWSGVRKNGLTDRDAVWGANLCGSKEAHIRWGQGWTYICYVRVTKIL